MHWLCGPARPPLAARLERDLAAGHHTEQRGARCTGLLRGRLRPGVSHGDGGVVAARPARNPLPVLGADKLPRGPAALQLRDGRLVRQWRLSGRRLETQGLRDRAKGGGVRGGEELIRGADATLEAVIVTSKILWHDSAPNEPWPTL
eukprot:1841506-Prymnesium_polylepis.2